MLYKVTETGGRSVFVLLRPTTMTEQGFLERQMEQWLADNPSAVLPEGEERVLVISQEAPFQNVTDVLAIDQRGNLVYSGPRKLDHQLSYSGGPGKG